MDPPMDHPERRRLTYLSADALAWAILDVLVRQGMDHVLAHGLRAKFDRIIDQISDKRGKARGEALYKAILQMDAALEAAADRQDLLELRRRLKRRPDSLELPDLPPKKRKPAPKSRSK